MLWNSCITCSSAMILSCRSGVKPVQSVSWAEDGQPEHFISALTDGRADRWTDWWRGWWSAVTNEPSSQTSPAFKVNRCMRALIWTPASLCRVSSRVCVRVDVCLRTRPVHVCLNLYSGIWFSICVLLSKSFVCICISGYVNTYPGLLPCFCVCVCVDIYCCAIWSRPC